jgi:hypothetical protein
MVDRPPRNRRRLGDPDLDWDTDLEAALIATVDTGKGLRMPTLLLHSTPVKGRVWALDYRLAHRTVPPDKQWSVAWLEHDDGLKLAKRCRKHEGWLTKLTPADRAFVRRVLRRDPPVGFMKKLRSIYIKLKRRNHG